MIIYLIAEAIVGLVGGILLAVLTKKAEGLVYNKLDKIGIDEVKNCLSEIGIYSDSINKIVDFISSF